MEPDITQQPTAEEVAAALLAVAALGQDNRFVITLRRLAYQFHKLHEPAPMLYGVARSSKWSALRDDFLEGKCCASCGGTKSLVAHHRVPFHVDQSLELEVDNLVPLCEAGKYGLNCHLLLGHLGNWRRVNVDVDSDVIRWAHALMDEV